MTGADDLMAADAAVGMNIASQLGHLTFFPAGIGLAVFNTLSHSGQEKLKAMLVTLIGESWDMNYYSGYEGQRQKKMGSLAV